MTGLDNWDELRTAYQVARLGTVSGAAELLGVHHATVIRHVDALEGRLGVRLFQRHARGYTPTEAGRELLSVAQIADEKFAQLASRIRGQGEAVSGELVVTSITGIIDLMTPVLTSFQQAHPGVVVRYLSDLRVLRLEFGEAHVAVRAGNKPQEPDYVVQPLTRLRQALCAAPSYVAAHGAPAGPADFGGHRFISVDSAAGRAPFYRWLSVHAPPECLTYVVNEPAAVMPAICAGAGMGFASLREMRANPGLVEVMASRPEWEVPLWIVTHVDLHRTGKVQAFVAHLKAMSQGWDDP